MHSANSQISMRSHADRRSVSIGVPLYLHAYLSSVSKPNYHAGWSLKRLQTDWSEHSLSARLVAMNPNDDPVKRKTLIRLHGCRVWSTCKSTPFVRFCAAVQFIIVLILGHTKLIPWSSDFVFENKERVSEIFIFVHFFFPQSYGASECFFFFFFFWFLLQSKSLEVRVIFFSPTKYS